MKKNFFNYMNQDDNIVEFFSDNVPEPTIDSVFEYYQAKRKEKDNIRKTLNEYLSTAIRIKIETPAFNGVNYYVHLYIPSICLILSVGTKIGGIKRNYTMKQCPILANVYTATVDGIVESANQWLTTFDRKIQIIENYSNVQSDNQWGWIYEKYTKQITYFDKVTVGTDYYMWKENYLRTMLYELVERQQDKLKANQFRSTDYLESIYNDLIPQKDTNTLYDSPLTTPKDVLGLLNTDLYNFIKIPGMKSTQFNHIFISIPVMTIIDIPLTNFMHWNFPHTTTKAVILRYKRDVLDTKFILWAIPGRTQYQKSTLNRQTALNTLNKILNELYTAHKSRIKPQQHRRRRPLTGLDNIIYWMAYQMNIPHTTLINEYGGTRKEFLSEQFYPYQIQCEWFGLGQHHQFQESDFTKYSDDAIGITKYAL